MLHPTASGCSILAYNVWAEYTWYDRTARALPDHVKVVRRYEKTTPIQPWTYIWPTTDRFAALDMSTTFDDPKGRGLRLVSVLLASRFHPTLKVVRVFDCASKRSAEFDTQAGFSDDGMPMNVVWTSDPAMSPMVMVACKTVKADAVAQD
ncbi:MAG: hypothetical protein AAFO75_07845, partial [Pseudomonadota bacterium]